MNSVEVSKLFPTGTVIVAYKGKTLGGAKFMPQWKIYPVINESHYLKSSDRILTKSRIENSINLEFEAVDPKCLNDSGDLYSLYDFDDSPDSLSFVPLDPENKVAHHFPLAKLKGKRELKEKYKIRWSFEIICDDNGVFMQKIKANS